MRDYFYFLYIDEIYTPNVNDLLELTRKEIIDRKYHHHFGLVGVIVPVNTLTTINFSCRRIQKRFYSQAEYPIMHYVDILNSRYLFSDLKHDINKKKRLITQLNSFIKESDFQAMFSFIDKEELLRRYGIYENSKMLKNIRKVKNNIFPKQVAKNYNLYFLSLRFLLLKFYQFLSRKPARGIIIAESRGEMEDNRLRNAFDLIQRYGISNIGIRELRSVIADMFIVHKKQNHAALQLADLILYPTYDAIIPLHNVRNDHFISYENLIRRKLYKGKESISVFP